MLSKRGNKSADSQDIPWRFAPGGNNRYDKISNPAGIVPFCTAENNLVREELHQFITQNAKIPSLALTYGFSSRSSQFATAMAAHINEYFHPHSPVEPEQILTTGSLTPMHSLLGHSLGDEGDGILVSRPIYGRFELDFGNIAGLKIVYADMNGVDPFEIDVVGCYEGALKRAAAEGVRICALLIVNPHNPLGRCYPSSSLKELMEFCERNEIHMISDEVYALSVFDTNDRDAVKFTSVLSIDPEDVIEVERLHVLYGMSKDFAAAGLRLGCLITQNTRLRKSIADNLRFHGPSGASIAIGIAILKDREFVKSFISLSRKRLGESYKYATQVFDKEGIKYHKGGNAGFFLYVDLSTWLQVNSLTKVSDNELEYALAQKLLNAGVGLHPCEEHNEARGHFRLVFSLERELLEEGLRRLVTVLRGLDVQYTPFVHDPGLI